MRTNQVKQILQKIGEEKFPSNEKYLQNIFNFKITFDNNENLQNPLFYYKTVNFINPQKYNKMFNFYNKFKI